MAKDSADVRRLLSQVIAEVITYLIHATDRKPANPEATNALARLDAIRARLNDDVGDAHEPIPDRHGMTVAQTVKEGGPK